MYTIVRFTSEPSLIGEIEELGRSMNLLRPGVFTGIRKRGDGFACDISDDPAWGVHMREIQRFITEFNEAIGQALRVGASVTMDVAVEREDREGGGLILVLDWSSEELAAFASAGLRLEISMYH